MVIKQKQRFKRSTGGPGLRERWQLPLDVLSNGLTGLVTGMFKRQIFH